MKRLVVACLSLGAFSASHVGSSQAQTWTGKASYYSGRNKTASGGRVGHLTAAHRSLPFGTRVKVTNLRNGQCATVTINDRGPFIRGRIIDVSTGAAGQLGMLGAGVAAVRVETF